MKIPLIVSLSALLIVASILGVWLLVDRVGLERFHRRGLLVFWLQYLILDVCLVVGIGTLFALWFNGWFG